MFLSPREKILKAINYEDNDDVKNIPFSFMLFDVLRKRCNDEYEFLEKQHTLGLDPVAYLGLRPVWEFNDHEQLRGFPITYHPDVKIVEWVERDEKENSQILNKIYKTPEGDLEIKIKRTADWRYSYHVPLIDDFLTSRMKKPLLDNRGDLKKLKYLLTKPDKYELDDFKTEAKKMKSFAKKYDIAVAAYWTIGLEAFAWFFGMEKFLLLSLDDPDFVLEFSDLIEDFNSARTEIYLDVGVDFIVRRGWYESTDFWSPKFFDTYILPPIKREAQKCHQAGSKLVYIQTSGTMPLLDSLLESGIDVLQGVDPVMGVGTDINTIKQKFNKKIAVWGGINEPLTIQKGSDDEIRAAVKNAIETLGPGGGLILSPIDNVIFANDKIWEQTYKFIRIVKEELGTYIMT